LFQILLKMRSVASYFVVEAKKLFNGEAPHEVNVHLISLLFLSIANHFFCHKI
jgi:hypothetical protein